jgi:uncharacterized SAM-binding protein YcdF (DUF218 family)
VTLKAIFSPLAEPLGLIWLLLVLALLGFLLRRKWQGVLALSLPVALLFLVGGTPLVETLVARAERPYARGRLEELPTVDAVVALGGSHSISRYDPFGFSISETEDRVLVGAELVRLGKASCLVLGGKGPLPGTSDRSGMLPVQAWLEKWKVFQGTITNLGICSNTHDEALHCRVLQKEHQWRKVILVTSALHLHRAQATFAHQGIEVIPVACDFQAYGVPHAAPWGSPFPSEHRFVLLAKWLHEVIGWWAYKARDWA